MGYTTIDKLSVAIGTERLSSALPDYSPTSSSERLQEMIESASGYIDSFLRRGRVLTPVNFSSFSDAAAATRAAALLSDVCIAIVAARIAPVATRGVTRGGEKNADWAQSWLNRIASGDISHDMPLRAGGRVRVVGDNEPAFPSSMFETLKVI